MNEAKYATGDVIASKYQLLEVVGEGGMGSVWRAKNLTLEVDVALKLIRRAVASERVIEQLLHEARTTARLGHPGIVRVFDFGETEQGDPFLVMEHLTGPLLADVLEQRSKLPPDLAVRILLPIAGALSAAHDKGIVHCDVKPENVVLSKGGGSDPNEMGPKLIDFGIAKLHLGEGEDLQGSFGLVGTPGYMSPEQSEGRADLDPRTDIWSFSVTLYEVVTGKRPFGEKMGRELIEAVRAGAEHPTTAFGAGDAALWRIVERGLAADPSARWRSMRELGQELTAWAFEQGIETDATGAALMNEWFDERPSRTSTPAVPIPVEVPTPEPKRLALVLDEAEQEEEAEEPPLGNESGGSVPPSRISLALEPFATNDSRASVPPTRVSVAPPRARPWGRIATGVLIVGAAGLAVSFGLRRLGQAQGTVGAPAPAVRATVAEMAPPVPPPPRPAVPVIEKDTTPAASERPRDLSECATGLLPPRSFESPARFDGLCEQADPRRGAQSMKTEIVRGGTGHVTDAMREWGLLRWYEMAAFAAARGACCPGEVRFTLPPPLGSCVPLARSLEAISDSVRGGGDPEEALSQYRSAVYCAIASGSGGAYSYGDGPQGGEETVFRRVLSRAIGRELPASRPATSSSSGPKARPAGPAPAAPKPETYE